MIPTIYITSNPVGAVIKSLHILSDFVTPDELREERVPKKSLEILIGCLEKREKNALFVGQNEKYKKYMALVSQNLGRLQSRPIVFLDVLNKGLKDKTGAYKNVDLDDFSSLTEFAPMLMKLYSRMPEEGKQFLEKQVWFRTGITDFPFELSEENGHALIINPFGDLAEVVNNEIRKENKEKILLGNQIRGINSFLTKENHKITEVIYSIEKFNRNAKEFKVHAESKDYIEDLWRGFEKTFELGLKKDEFKKLATDSILINRKIAELKYAKIIAATNPEYINLNMINNASTKKIFSRVSERTGRDISTLGKKLIWDTRKLPAAGVLEPQAMNRISGWAYAMAGLYDQEPIIVEKAHEEKPIKFFRSKKYPYILAGAPVWDIEADLDKVEEKLKEYLHEDIRNMEFSIMTSEVLLYMLNVRTFPTLTDMKKEWDWQRDILDGKKVQPFDISSLRTDMPRETRPSSTSAFCFAHKFTNNLPMSFFPPSIQKNKMSLSGDLLHKIFNELGLNQKYALANFGLDVMDKKDYCEVRLVQPWSPTEEDWERGVELLESKIKQADRKILKRLEEFEGVPNVFHEMRDFLYESKANRASILDGGKPDAVGIIEGTQSPIIMDMKRRIGTYFPVQYFLKQTIRYGLAIIQGMGLDTETFYSVIVQTPSTQRSFAESEKYDKGNYRKQKITIRENEIDSNFVEETKAELILEWLGNSILKQDKSKGIFFRLLYKDDKKHGCLRCFANRPNEFTCNYWLTGREETWEDSERKRTPFINHP